MEDALAQANFGEALSHLDTLITSCPPDQRKNLLYNHNVNGVPTFHHLARFTFPDAHLPYLDNGVDIFLDYGYNVNSDFFPVQILPGAYADPYTCLMASVVNKNQIFLECLLRHGARADICSKQGVSPCQKAIKIGAVNCLQSLVNFGGKAILTTAPNKNDPPALHMAVDYCQAEIVSYLLNNEELGVDVREKVVYYGRMEFTPLERAFENPNGQVLMVLLEKLFTDDRFRKLYLHLGALELEEAVAMLPLFSDEEIAQDKIEGRWTLHWLNYRAFREGPRLDFTKKLIFHWVQCGWNVNSESRSYLSLSMDLGCVAYPSGEVNGITLLHLACLHKAPVEIIQWLVEDLGGIVNCKTEGIWEVTPLLISIIQENWRSAEYLIEKGADLNFKGIFDGRRLSRFMKRNLATGNWERLSSLNPVELLLRLGEGAEGFQLLEKMLENPNYVPTGASEFHLALEGNNPRYVCQVLKKYGGIIPNSDLMLMKDCGNSDIPEMVPSLQFFLRSLYWRERRLDKKDADALVYIVQFLVNAGVDLSLVWKKVSILRVIHQRLAHNAEMLGLLQYLLGMKTLPINAVHCDHSGLIDFLQLLMYDYCHEDDVHCTNPNNPVHWPIEIIKLLVTHGLDLCGQEKDTFNYFHLGSGQMFKMMFAAGLKVDQDFFEEDNICSAGDHEKEEIEKEWGELREWKEEFDKKEAGSLKHLCRLQIRKSIEYVKDLEKLDELPKHLIDYVLCRNYL